MRRGVLLVSILLLGGCVAAGPMQTQFQPGAASFAAERGYGALVGQAFMRQVGGGVVTAAGNNVLLIPDQPYTRELVQRLQTGVSAPGEEDPVRAYTKTTVADASGSFVFTDLPAGNYIALTAVRWGAPTQYGISQQGGVVAEAVSVQSGSTSRVILR